MFYILHFKKLRVETPILESPPKVMLVTQDEEGPLLFMPTIKMALAVGGTNCSFTK